MVRNAFDSKSSERAPRPAPRLGSVAAWAFVASVGLFGVFGLFLSWRNPAPDYPAFPQVSLYDGFERPAGREPLSRPGSAWRVLSGLWVASDGVAQIVAPTSVESIPLASGGYAFPLWGLAVLDPPASTSVAVSFYPVEAGCGLAFRVLDGRNFWAVVAAPKSATWNIIRVQDGVAELEANTGLSPTANQTRVTVIDEGKDFTVVVDDTFFPQGVSARFASTALRGQTAAGLVAFEKCASARWTKIAFLE